MALFRLRPKAGRHELGAAVTAIPAILAPPIVASYVAPVEPFFRAAPAPSAEPAVAADVPEQPVEAARVDVFEPVAELPVQFYEPVPEPPIEVFEPMAPEVQVFEPVVEVPVEVFEPVVEVPVEVFVRAAEVPVQVLAPEPSLQAVEPAPEHVMPPVQAFMVLPSLFVVEAPVAQLPDVVQLPPAAGVPDEEPPVQPAQVVLPRVEAAPYEPAESRVQLTFRDGSTAALAPGSAQAKALEAIASVLTKRD